MRQTGQRPATHHRHRSWFLIFAPILILAAGFLLVANQEVIASRLPFGVLREHIGGRMTNEDVLSLKAAGVGDDLIAEKISSAPCWFHLSTADLITLKQAGVSDRLISVMMRTMTH